MPASQCRKTSPPHPLARPLRFLAVAALVCGLITLTAQLTVARQDASSGQQPAPGAAGPATSPGPLINSILQPTGNTPLTIFPEVVTPPMQVVGGLQPATQINLIPEGTYMLDRTGRFAPSADGRDLVFALDYNGMPTIDPTFLVLPNLERLRVEESLVPTRDQRFRVTGLVTEYRNRNCLLLQHVVPTWSPTTTTQQASTQSTTMPTTGPVALVLPTAPQQPPPPPVPATNHAASTEPADVMLTEMLSPTEAPAPTTMVTLPAPPAPADATSGGAAVAPKAPTITLLREGSPIIDHVARLTRTADGKDEEIVFDSDGRNMHDPPMIVLPNLKLISMEDAVLGYNRDLRFRVTGVVTEYRGRNYILLQKAVVMVDSVQSF